VPLAQLFLSGPVADDEAAWIVRDEGVIFRRLVDQLAVDIPADAFRLPVERIEVVFLGRIKGELDARTATGLAVVEIVQLNNACVLADELDIDFVMRFTEIGAV
jgi:hypothetical protein